MMKIDGYSTRSTSDRAPAAGPVLPGLNFQTFSAATFSDIPAICRYLESGFGIQAQTTLMMLGACKMHVVHGRIQTLTHWDYPNIALTWTDANAAPEVMFRGVRVLPGTVLARLLGPNLLMDMFRSCAKSLSMSPRFHEPMIGWRQTRKPASRAR